MNGRRMRSMGVARTRQPLMSGTTVQARSGSISVFTTLNRRVRRKVTGGPRDLSASDSSMPGAVQI